MANENAGSLGSSREDKGREKELAGRAAAKLVKDGDVVGMELTKKSRARALIEDFMNAANGTMARFLDARGVSSISLPVY